MIKQFEPIRRLKDAWAVFKAVRKGNLGPGKICSDLEEEIKKITHAKYCLTTTSGTVGLMMAIEALNLPKGSTILFPAYTFLAGANAARFMGYKVKLVDINYRTLCMDKDLFYYALKNTRNISCAIFVNHNAYCGNDITEIKETCDRFNVPLIEDSCQSIGVKKSGKTGKIGVYSFSVPKLVTGGQGGGIITDDPKLAEKLARIRDHGDNWREDRIHKHIGINLRYNDIQASYVLSQLKDIKKLLTKRWQICYEYNRYINVEGFYADTMSNDTPWMIIYRSKNADQIIEELNKKGICAVKYYRAINENPPYRTKAKYPIAERISKELIYLPSSLSLKKRQIRKICKIILKVEKE